MFPATHAQGDVRPRRPVQKLASAVGRIGANAHDAFPRSAAFDALAGDTPFRDRIAVETKAQAAAIFDALRAVTLRDMKLAWFLGELRYLPARLIGRWPAADPGRPFFTSLLEGGTVILAGDEPREIVTGSAGLLHRITDQAPVHFVNVESFHAFSNPAYEKLILSFRVERADRLGHRLMVLEHATVALSSEAAHRFKPYWLFIKPAGAFVSRELLKATARRAEAAN